MTDWSVKDKTLLITGATSGIGLAAAIELARKGARLVLVGRDRSRGSSAVGQVKQQTGNKQVEFLQADFASLESVATAAQTFLASKRPLHALINNAGVVNTTRRISQDSIEEMFAVNYLAHYLLTRLLLERIKESGPARIVHVASHAYAFCKGINFSDINHSRGYSTFKVYGHSKLANMLFSNELSRRLRGTGVTSNSLHPGAVSTGLGTNNGMLGKVLPVLLKRFFRTPEQGAATAVYLASAAEIDGVTGKYFFNCKAVEPKAWANDSVAEGRLWGMSEKLLQGYL